MASWLSDLVRDGALNEILALLSRTADAARGAASADRADSLFLALDKLYNLLEIDRALPPEERTVLLSSAELERALHLVLQRPDQKLVTYGTLAPGGSNHDRVEALRGNWQRCFVRGRRWAAADGDPAFRWNPTEPEVPAMLLVSDQLPSAWPELDRFEGSLYRRRLVPVRGEDAHHVAYLYESLDQPISE